MYAGDVTHSPSSKTLAVKLCILRTMAFETEEICNTMYFSKCVYKSFQALFGKYSYSNLTMKIEF